MTTEYHTSDGVTSPRTAPGAPENVRAEVEQTRADLGDTVTALTGKVNTRARLRGAVSSMKTRSASGAPRVRTQAQRAQQAVRNRPVPAAVIALAAAGAVAAGILGRRRAAKARSARNRWLHGFLHR